MSSEAYGFLRAAVLRAHPGAQLQADGIGFVVRDECDRALGRKAYSVARAWREAYRLVAENGHAHSNIKAGT